VVAGAARVELKGVGGSIQAVVAADVPDAEVAGALSATLGQAAGFLGRAAITVVLPGRRLGPELAAAVVEAMAAAPDAALAGMQTTVPRPGARAARAPAPHAGHPIVHGQTLRAGQEIRHGGDVVVLGNIHRGARVIAEGNVIILGRLEGTAHAGALGDADRFIYAGQFAPTQVRIGAYIAAGPQDAGPAPGEQLPTGKGPEWARVEDDAIVVESWPGGSRPGRAARVGGRRARPA